jgi:SdrD B-like domain/Subtilase family
MLRTKCLLTAVEQLEERLVLTSTQVFDSRGVNLLAPAQPGQQAQVWDNLTGAGVRVGVIEAGRVGKQGTDNLFSDKVSPSAVFEADVLAVADNTAAITRQDGHATATASVIVAAPTFAENNAVATVQNQPVFYGLARGTALLSSTIAMTPTIGAEEFQYFQQMLARSPELTQIRNTPVANRTPEQQQKLQDARETSVNAILRHNLARGFAKIGTYNQQTSAAINISALLDESAPNTGSGQPSLLLDYVAQATQSLAVVGTPNEPSEVESTALLSAYNRLTVSGMEQDVRGGKFTRVSVPAVPAAGTRSLIDLVAPGFGVRVIEMHKGNNQQFAPVTVSTAGTSFATPMVTSAVALLTEYIAKHPAEVNAIAAHRLVMKAVLMNSADKIEGALPDQYGGQKMLRTVIGAANAMNPDHHRRNWTEFDNVVDSYAVPSGVQNPAALIAERKNTPLSPEFGAGALNFGRALSQLRGGQGGFKNPGRAPDGHGVVGWDMSTMVNAQGNPAELIAADGGYLRRVYTNLYLKPGSQFSATLTWERPVEMKTDAGQLTAAYAVSNKYNAKDAAFATKPPNLNLYLMPKNAQNLNQAVWASTSEQSNTEHFFFQMPNPNVQDPRYSAAGYELWVTSKETTKSIDYGLAWWGERGQPPENQPKDLKGKSFNDANGDGIQNPTESGRAGVRVALLDSAGTELDSVTTDWQGYYSFEVQDGSYQL